MDYDCDICDKTINIESKSKHRHCITLTEFERSIRGFFLKHTIKNLNFSDIDEKNNKNFTIYCKKFEMNLIRNHFKLIFDTEFFHISYLKKTLTQQKFIKKNFY